MQEKTIHLKLLPQFLVSFLSLGRHRDIEILALLLAEQLEPGGTERTQVRGYREGGAHLCSSTAPRGPFPRPGEPPNHPQWLEGCLWVPRCPGDPPSLERASSACSGGHTEPWCGSQTNPDPKPTDKLVFLVAATGTGWANPLPSAALRGQHMAGAGTAHPEHTDRMLLQRRGKSQAAIIRNHGNATQIPGVSPCWGHNQSVLDTQTLPWHPWVPHTHPLMAPVTLSSSRGGAEPSMELEQVLLAGLRGCHIPIYKHPVLLCVHGAHKTFTSHHPSTPDFCSSEIPKDKEPMKSFLLVRSQSQISTDNRLSLSASFSWLEERKGEGWVLSWQLLPHPSVPPCPTRTRLPRVGMVLKAC